MVKIIWTILLLLLFVLLIIYLTPKVDGEEPINHSDLYLTAKTGLYGIDLNQTLTLDSNPLKIANYGFTERSWIKEVIIQTARKHYIDEDLFLKIAVCESNLRPQAKNLLSTASGIFQFLSSTFYKYAKAYELPTEDKNDPIIQAELAALMIKDGGLSNWNESRECWKHEL